MIFKGASYRESSELERATGELGGDATAAYSTTDATAAAGALA